MCRAADQTITPSAVMNVIKDKLDEVDRAVERVADGKARFRAMFVNAV